MTSQKLAKLKAPDAPGVYVWRDARTRPLYIGRATSLRDRLRSYFAADLIETRGPRIVDMVVKAAAVTWQETDSVLEAILLEAALIKRYQPRYNVDERDDKSDQYVIVTDEPWPRVFLARARDFDSLKLRGELPYSVSAAFGPFVQAGLVKEALRILRKLFPFRDKKAADPRHEAFYRALGRSPRADGPDAHARYLKTIRYLTLFFEGRKRLIRKGLAADMAAAAADMRFEDASRYKRLLYAIDHIDDVSLIKQESARGAGKEGGAFRIEAYDIAHISGTNVTGAMTVVAGGEAEPGQYRKFIVRRQANDDAASLAEILSRRLDHPEWPFPDLIAVDGNDIQKRAAEAVLKARRISIPVVAVTKDERHRASHLLGDPALARRHKAAIVLANAEAHRFALAFHRARRRKSLI
ncbi:MAG: GIY-YIG nuclease family protein [Patescibacteria group bacterium]|nr:GIY-YIG nuclease family protein [Patescibacteria group bacterium]